MLFGKADIKNCQSMRDVLDVFCDLSEEKVSLKKSMVYFSLNVPAKKRADLCSCLELHSIPNLGKYLEFPLKQPGSSKHDFDFVIKQIQRKLAGWKARLLSFAGKVVLTQSVLAAIPAYVMQGTMLLGKTIEAIDQVRRNFIWGSTEDEKTAHN